MKQGWYLKHVIFCFQLWEESQAENARLRVEMAGIRFDSSFFAAAPILVVVVDPNAGGWVVDPHAGGGSQS